MQSLHTDVQNYHNEIENSVGALGNPTLDLLRDNRAGHTDLMAKLTNVHIKVKKKKMK